MIQCFESKAQILCQIFKYIINASFISISNLNFNKQYIGF